MILFPAIDIRNGKCVRLIQGDYNNEKIYSDSPVDMAKKWEAIGADWLHIVDLDGAKSGISVNANVMKQIAKGVDIPVQIGGGIRDIETVIHYLENGAARVILGTAALNDSVFLKEAITTFRDKIAVSIDARNGYVATDGWTGTSSVKAIDLLQRLADIGVQTIIYTDILKDGMLKGPNFTELETMNKSSHMKVIASGGVATAADIGRLVDLDMYGAIIGKALYEEKLSLEELLEVAR